MRPAGLEHGRSRCARLLEEQQIEVLAPESAAPGRAATGTGWQRGGDALLPAPERHSPQLRTRSLPQRLAYAQRVEQRQIARRDALAADLAARKRPGLEERHRPPRPREQNGGA